MAFVSASRTGANWYGSVSVARPAGAVEGTLLIHVAYAYGTSGANTLTPPSGFTTAQSYSAGFDSAAWVAYKVMGASEPSSYNWSASVGTTGWVAQIVYDTTTTVADSAGAKDAGGATTATAPSVPGGLAGATLVTIIAGWEAGKAPFTPPAGMTERLDEADASNGGSIGVFDQGLAANGATGTRVAGSTGTQPAFCVNLVLSGGSGDIEAPIITGPITVTGRTSTGYTLGGWGATDNVAVTGYERSLDGGSTWSDIGLVTTSAVTGRTPGSTDAVRVRAYDAAGNRSTALTASVTLRYGGVTGATIVAQTATGDDGPGALYDSMRPPATNARVYEFDIVTPPASGTLAVYNNGSFSLTGAVDGAHTLALRVWEDGVDLGVLTHTLNVGPNNFSTLTMGAKASVSASLTAGGNQLSSVLAQAKASLTASLQTLGTMPAASMAARATATSSLRVGVNLAASMAARATATASLRVGVNMASAMGARAVTSADLLAAGPNAIPATAMSAASSLSASLYTVSPVGSVSVASRATLAADLLAPGPNLLPNVFMTTAASLVGALGESDTRLTASAGSRASVSASLAVGVRFACAMSSRSTLRAYIDGSRIEDHPLRVSATLDQPVVVPSEYRTVVVPAL